MRMSDLSSDVGSSELVTAIVALHEHRRFHALVERRDEGLIARFCRSLLALFLTGIAVELTLSPIALYHFHQTGILGAFANIVAIPPTPFVILPGSDELRVWQECGSTCRSRWSP